MSEDQKQVSNALAGHQRLPVRVCGHIVCRSEDSVWRNGVNLIPCLEQNLSTQTEMMERALSAYRESRLATVEKNPGPTQKPVRTEERRRPREQEVVEVLVQWLELFGFDSTGYSIAGDVQQWRLWIEDAGDWMKLCKYKLAVFYQYAQKDLLEDKTLPPSPLKNTTSHPLHLLGGRAGRFLRRMIRKTAPLRQVLLSSLLLIKTGMPRPDKDALLEAARKTLAALVTPRKTEWIHKPIVVPGLSDHRRRHGIVSFAELEEQVRRTAREYFTGVRFGNHDLFSTPITPSFSACYVRSRRAFGTFGELLDRGLLETEPRRDLRLASNIEEEYIGSDQNPTISLGGFDGMRDQFLRSYFDALKIAMKEEPIASAVPLAEALKVRVITKGPPMTQFVLKPLQRFMWRVLKNHPSCALIGDPVDVSKLAPRLGRLIGDQAWCSGDYSDATNQMDPRLSEAAWQTVCDVCAVPRALKELGSRVLTGHWLEVDRDGTLMPQQWGQLMGSIISFPILCIVNATVCRMALEHDLDCGLSLSRAPLMVNGDDCLFPVGPAGYAAWNLFGKMAGLSPSVGKVYYSKHFCNINSTTFVYDGENPDDRAVFKRVDVIRLGLCFGLKRSIAEVEEEDEFRELRLLGNGQEWDSSIGAQHRALMFECPPQCYDRVHRKFLARNRELLTTATEYLIPWYVPECYGGIGLQPIGEMGPSKTDELIVTAMVHWRAWTEVQPRLPVQWKGPAKTKIRQVAVEQLRRVLPDLETHWVSQGSSEVDGLDSPSLASWVLYQRPQDVLSVVSDVRAARDALCEIRRVRSWYLKHMDKFAWMTPSAYMPPRRLVTEVRIEERLPALLPTQLEIAWRDVDNLLQADADEATVRWSRRFAVAPNSDTQIPTWTEALEDEHTLWRLNLDPDLLQ